MRWMLPVTLVLLATAEAAAQAGAAWVEFTPNPARLDMAPTALSSTTTEADFAVGDLDLDGWVDVVAVREEPSSLPGKRNNMLLMNEQGVLRDRTASFAALSDVPGDAGFLTPSGERDAEIGDVDGDGWPDVVTARTLHDGEPKATSHPRIYLNLADDGSGAWLGLGHQDARIPQLLTVGGLAVAPRFVAVSLGDVENDGDLDLHFVDQDGIGTGIPPEAPGHDLDDRLLVNDGHGYYTDGSSAALTETQLRSLYGIDTRIQDLNGDGAADIVHLTADGDPTGLFVEYNAPADLGHFQALGQQSIGSGSPYAFDIAELNNDGLPDIAIEDDAADRFRLNQGVDALGRVVWGPLKSFLYVSGFDDGFGGNVHIRDLDGDGWNDVLICDVDIDVADCTRRLHIFHNLGGAPGADVDLREEAKTGGSSWVGVAGMGATDLKGSYDVAVADFDRDGDGDMLVSRCNGTYFWESTLDPGQPLCQADLGHGGPGAMQLSICGEPLEWTGAQASLSLSGAAPLEAVFLPLGLQDSPTPLKGGVLVPNPPLIVVLGLFTDAAGSLQLPVVGLGGTLATVYLQAIVKNGPVTEFSNALELVIGL